jgi:RNA polymerase sigma-70 factor (ECF subfamily)
LKFIVRLDREEDAKWLYSSLTGRDTPLQKELAPLGLRNVEGPSPLGGSAGRSRRSPELVSPRGSAGGSRRSPELASLAMFPLAGCWSGMAKAAVVIFVERHGQALRNYCSRRSSRDAEDLVQETFLRVIQRGEDLATLLAATEQQQRAYLFCVVRHLQVDWWRKLRREVRVDTVLEVACEPPEDRLESEEEKAKLLSYLGRLPRKHADAIYLRYIEELSLEAIAKILGAPVTSVSNWIHRGRAKLRKLVEAELSKKVKYRECEIEPE